MIIDNYVITEPIYNILLKVRSELRNGKLRFIEQKGDQIKVTCPVHKGGGESHASCVIYGVNDDRPNWFCFACEEHGDFVSFVAKCFDSDYRYAKDWLLENYGDVFLVNSRLELEDIDLSKETDDKKYLDESFLANLQNYHPYMTKRGLSDEIIEKFELKYDPLDQTIVFPIRDQKGNLVSFTKRSVNTKKFYIPKDFKKENIYLLYNILSEGITDIGVCEGQFSALTAWQYGVPSVALMGAGTTEAQMGVLNSIPVKRFRLLYDGDSAGRKGAERFKKLVRKDIFVDDIILPDGKDVNDLTKEEFDRLLND